MKNVLVLGAGISGLGAAQVLAKRGFNVVLSDLADRIGEDRKSVV